MRPHPTARRGDAGPAPATCDRGEIRGGRAMEMTKLNGGSLRAGGYDERTRKLVVELTSGTFEYSGVSPEVWRRLASASSPWSYFRDNIDEEFVAKRVR